MGYVHLFLCLWLQFSTVATATVEPRFCPSENRTAEVLEDAINTPAPQSLKDHTAEFVPPEHIEVLPGVHFFIGYGLANVIVVEAPEGLVVIDTSDSQTAVAPIIDIIRANVSSAPFKAIIYTHFHNDHIGGAQAFELNQPDEEPMEVWAHEDLEKEFWTLWQYNRPLVVRSFRQLGIDLPDGAFINAGVGKEFVADLEAGMLLVPVTHTFTGEEMEINIAGLDMTLIFIPGESVDQIAVHIPSMKAVAIGDLVYKAFPNLYPIRGGTPRPVDEWFKSVDKIRQLDVDYVLPSHTKPIVGKEEIERILTLYRDAIQYVHDQTVRVMNQGVHPDVVAQSMQLPASIVDEVYLLEHYGTVEWNVKAVHEIYMGWFSGFIAELFPLTPYDEAQRWLNVVEPEALLLDALNSIIRGGDKELRWAIKATDILWQNRANYPPELEDFRQEVLAVRTEAILELASLQTSPNARNYLLRWLLEDNCEILNRTPVFDDGGAILILPPFNLIKKLSVLLKAEDLAGIHSVYVLEFTDIDQNYTLTLRNSIMEIQEGGRTEYDVKIIVPFEQFRFVVLQIRTLEEVGAEVEPDMDAGDTFMSYFDNPNENYF